MTIPGSGQPDQRPEVSASENVARCLKEPINPTSQLTLVEAEYTFSSRPTGPLGGFCYLPLGRNSGVLGFDIRFVYLSDLTK